MVELGVAIMKSIREVVKKFYKELRDEINNKRKNS